MRTVEDLPEEVAELAEVASRLVALDPESRHAVGELARLMGQRLERPQERMALPADERKLWEDAGASFEPRGAAINAVRATVAFVDLLGRSVEGDAAVADLLRVDRSRISQRLRERSLYAFVHGDARYFPRWQFVDGRTLPGLKEALAELDEDVHPLVLDHWFTTPSVDLEVGDASVSPVHWLTTGGSPEPVVALAADL